MNIFSRLRDLIFGSSKARELDRAKTTFLERVREAMYLVPAEARRKLGRGWATRRLGARTRARRLRSLTKIERAYARSRGWIR